MKDIRSVVVFFLAGFTFCIPGFADEFVYNGGFELGLAGSGVPGSTVVPQGWTEGANPHWFDSNGTPHGGVRAGYSGAAHSESIIEQSFATVPGATYLVSGWFLLSNQVFSSHGLQSGSLYWNGTQVATILSTSGYTQISAKVSGTGHDTVGVGLRDDQSFSSVDDISVQGPGVAPVLALSAIPEPSTLGLVGLALLLPVALGRLRRRVH